MKRNRASEWTTSLAGILLALMALGGCAPAKRPPRESPPVRTDASPCEAPYPIGYRFIRLDESRQAAVWYPTSDPPSTFAYSDSLASDLAVNGTPTRCGRFPLVVFSHGLGGCGTQSVFFTEELARSGYVVVAPDHRDASCRVDGGGALRLVMPQESFFDPKRWTEETHVDREQDLERVIDLTLADRELSSIVDPGRIGSAGHSLGAYAILGMLGMWPSWKDERIKVAVAFSPYVVPFMIQKTVSTIEAPVMYHGAELDIGITPFLRGDEGAYRASSAPKCYVELRGGSHFEWTNLICLGVKSVSACNARPNARLINRFSIAFLNRYLKATEEPLLISGGEGLARFQCDLSSP